MSRSLATRCRQSRYGMERLRRPHSELLSNARPAIGRKEARHSTPWSAKEQVFSGSPVAPPQNAERCAEAKSSQGQSERRRRSKNLCFPTANRRLRPDDKTDNEWEKTVVMRDQTRAENR